MNAIHDQADLRALARVARALAPDYGGDDATLLTVSENATFRVDRAARPVAALRFYRPGGRTAAAIAAEIAWIEALRRDRVVPVATPLSGPDGAAIRAVDTSGGGADRWAAAFAWVAGAVPPVDAATFRAMGALAARLHAHARNWTPPPGSERPPLDRADEDWGEWRDSPEVDRGARDTIARAIARADASLAGTGDDPDRAGLIHTDLRVANLLQADGPCPVVLDFDDCAFGPFAADFAGSASFLEHEDGLPAHARAWCDGYGAAGGDVSALYPLLPAATLRRRVRLLAWITSHADAPLARALGPGFADGTVKVAQAFLADRLLTG